VADYIDSHQRWDSIRGGEDSFLQQLSKQQLLVKDPDPEKEGLNVCIIARMHLASNWE
jgi:hypothetical protein